MTDKNREVEKREFKNLRIELLKEYEDSPAQTEDCKTNTEAEAILLRQSLFENYEATEENEKTQENKYVDEELDNGDEAPVKKLKRGRGL